MSAINVARIAGATRRLSLSPATGLCARGLHFRVSEKERISLQQHDSRRASALISSTRRSKTLTKMSAEPAGAAVVEEAAEVREDVEFWERIQAHQKSAAKLSPIEEARTLLSRCSRGMLSTHSKRLPGYPFGSMVGYAADADGCPILAITSLSPHTSDLEANPKCSLLVARDPKEQSEALLAISGDAVKVPDAEREAVRDLYLKVHPGAFWVDFADFSFVRIEPYRVRFTANIATFAVGASVTEFDGEEFGRAAVDPISAFEEPIAGHMNADHEDAIRAMAERALGIKVASAKILNVDRFGFRVEVPLNGQLSRVRLPFPRAAKDRKDVKNLIVEMTKEAMQAQAARESLLLP
eukprot:TRINITY_DN23383_c0_g1_i1.p1 TRINITY_DN23383_c0_g1~~TRINITY_DN23383_c0_g1_i1.p1  ORF type:complete len:372 (+),score=67.60 TRINITY_DN23383_c0_g1_i1:56-1117(+)